MHEGPEREPGKESGKRDPEAGQPASARRCGGHRKRHERERADELGKGIPEIRHEPQTGTRPKPCMIRVGDEVRKCVDSARGALPVGFCTGQPIAGESKRDPDELGQQQRQTDPDGDQPQAKEDAQTCLRVIKTQNGAPCQPGSKRDGEHKQ